MKPFVVLNKVQLRNKELVKHFITSGFEIYVDKPVRSGK